MFQVVLIFVGTDDFYWEMLVFNLIFGWLNVLFAHLFTDFHSRPLDLSRKGLPLSMLTATKFLQKLTISFQ